MKKLLLLIALLGLVAVAVAGRHSALPFAQEIPRESKIQPKEVTLGKDSQSDKYGEVPFNHETHSLKKYSPDGTSVLSCVDCHHTDQPAASLKPPLKTSERNT